MENIQKIKVSIKKEDLLTLSHNVAKADKRISRKRVHEADAIVFIAIAAVICGVETWNDMELFAKTKEDLWKELFPTYKKAPSHDTFNRFFSILDTEKFELNFRDWIRDIMQGIKYRGHIAIDGKTISKASETENEKDSRKKNLIMGPRSKMHIISAYAADIHLCLGQLKTDIKSNEITQIPVLVKSLDIKDCVLSFDAMGCQKEIAKTIREQGGDYLFFVKDNHKKLRKHLETILACEKTRPRKTRNSSADSYEHTHGRIEIRDCFACNEKYCFGSHIADWQDVSTMAVITSERRIKATGEISIDTRYVITSLKTNAREIMKYARNHWRIENNLHWQLDVSFNEDNGRMKNNAAQNFSLLSKIALTILKNDKSKIGIKSKRKLAGWSNDFLLKLLDNF